MLRSLTATSSLALLLLAVFPQASSQRSGCLGGRLYLG